MAVRDTLSITTSAEGVSVRLRGMSITFEGKDCAEALGRAGQFLDQAYAKADEMKRRYEAEMENHK